LTFPLGFWDINLLLAVTAIILLITSEMLSSQYGKTNILINRKKLKNTAITVSTLFLISIAIRIVDIILT
jgi:hypothetical protein